MTRSNDNRSENEVLFGRAEQVMPGGISHELRHRAPFPIYVEKAEGAYKWDTEGRRYIDYKMGSASVLLGHAHPDIVTAIAEQAARVPFSADCHPLEIEWAEIVASLFPSAELVRFTGSGTESTMLAMRLARAATGKPKVLRIDGHYHGWHDHAIKGGKPGDPSAVTLGVPQAVSDLIVVANADSDAVRDAIQADPEIGTIIVEASGANYGGVPLPDGFLADLRNIADETASVLIFDEVITGFRWSPGGIQARDGVVPDLTALAKILTGGLPGGAVVGRRDLMTRLDPREAEQGHSPPVTHKGTFNASPVIAAGALAGLRHVSTGAPQKTADARAAALRTGLVEILDRLDIPGAVYGESSTFHIFIGASENRSVAGLTAQQVRSMPPLLVKAFRLGLNERGVDLMSRTSGVTSAAHSETDIADTLQVFEDVFRDLRRGQLIPA